MDSGSGPVAVYVGRLIVRPEVNGDFLARHASTVLQLTRSTAVVTSHRSGRSLSVMAVSNSTTSQSCQSQPLPPQEGPQAQLSVVVTSVASDSHTWNLVYLQLLVEELGHHVVNLGPCVPDELIEEAGRDADLIVVSSVSGHGFQDGMRLIRRLRAAPGVCATPAVIGGKLSTSGLDDGSRSRALRCAGFDAVFENADATSEFCAFLTKMSTRFSFGAEAADATRFAVAR